MENLAPDSPEMLNFYYLLVGSNEDLQAEVRKYEHSFELLDQVSCFKGVYLKKTGFLGLFLPAFTLDNCVAILEKVVTDRGWSGCSFE